MLLVATLLVGLLGELNFERCAVRVNNAVLASLFLCSKDPQRSLKNKGQTVEAS